jgi:beta-galactosidase
MNLVAADARRLKLLVSEFQMEPPYVGCYGSGVRCAIFRGILLVTLSLALLRPAGTLAADVAAPAPRLTEDFDSGWLFEQGDFATAMMPAFEDAGWRTVTLPHDWSSDGPFQPGFGSGNGYAPGGIGWYRKHFQLAAAPGKSVTLEFDGVYDFSEVWINGQFAGGRPYGFSSFQCDLTPFVKFGGRPNVVAVRVDHSRFADSRYYTGSGIYRNVRLVAADELHVAHWGVYITTPQVSADSATVHVETAIENDSGTNKTFTLETSVRTAAGQIAATPNTTASRTLGAPVSDPAQTALPSIGGSNANSGTLTQDLVIRHPHLWQLDDPQLYFAVSKIISDGAVVDEVTNIFGLRESHFDASRGFFLNGKNLKIKGVCLHHDAGPIGAAVPAKVLERRLRTLQEIGVNAIRTSHNPPDPVLLDLCDRLGLLVMDEAFDEFTPGKNKWVAGVNVGMPTHFGYSELFAQWSVADIQDLVRRDRNHPSVILWSIGNEIDYANDPFSHPVLGANYHPENPRAESLVACAQPLVAAVKALDRTRPVTAALATVAMSDAAGLSGLLDVDGYNYQEARYAEDHRRYPQRIITGSENGHQYEAWLAVRDNDFIAGQFLWTGADYLGEANAWPNRANGAGLLDLCGFKKPLGWFRQSLWSDRPMVYLCVTRGDGRGGFSGRESWNWPANSTVTVLGCANCSEVALLLNGKTFGMRKISEAEHGVLRWDIPYEPGTLQAIGRTEGRDVCRFALQTAGAPAQIRLQADSPELHADGRDVCHIEFEIIDANGVRVPDAASELHFQITGPGRILGIGNGDLNSAEDCKSATHHAFQGRGLLILQSTPSAGEIVLSASSPGLPATSVLLHSR